MSCLAWESILKEREQLNLSPYQVTQAETQRTAADGTVLARLPETYQWLLVPVQATPQAAVTWEALRLSGTDALAVRASKKLRTDEHYLTSFGSTRLRMELDKIPLWRGDHVAVKQLVEDFAKYLYLPRLSDSRVLLESIRDGVSLLTWAQDSFGFAESFDEAAGRYMALRGGQVISLADAYAPGLLVKREVASRQLDAQRVTPAPVGFPGQVEVDGSGPPPTVSGGGTVEQAAPASATPKRFHGTALLDTARVGRDASRIAEEVISHLSGLMGASVRVTIEIEADIPAGASDQIVRIVTENSRTLKFLEHGFEKE